MKRILITGALGYIGSVLSNYLTENDYNCTCYDTGFFKDCLLYGNDSIDSIDSIIRDARAFREDDLDGTDVVIHLAGISNDPFGNLTHEKIYDPTLDYTVKLASMCKKRGVKFIFPSSCSVYGKGKGNGKDKLLNEDSITDPLTPYSLNKLQIEEELRKLSDSTFSPIVLRLATVFGLSPRMRFDIVINMLVGMALTTNEIILNSNGKAWRPHVHILDVCKALKMCVEMDWSTGEPLVLNVGDVDNNFQIIEIARIIQKHCTACEIKFLRTSSTADYELINDRKIQDGVDTRTYKVSFDRIKKYLPDFQCDWHVQRGIENLIEKLKNIQLTASQFKNFNYYRLQKIEFLHSNQYISDDLYWIN